MGHAGAIVGGEEDTAELKWLLCECGIIVMESPAEIGKMMADLMGLRHDLFINF